MKSLQLIRIFYFDTSVIIDWFASFNIFEDEHCKCDHFNLVRPKSYYIVHYVAWNIHQMWWSVNVLINIFIDKDTFLYRQNYFHFHYDEWRFYLIFYVLKDAFGSIWLWTFDFPLICDADQNGYYNDCIATVYAILSSDPTIYLLVVLLWPVYCLDGAIRFLALGYLWQRNPHDCQRHLWIPNDAVVQR